MALGGRSTFMLARQTRRRRVIMLGARHGSTNPWLADDVIILGVRADPVPEDTLVDVGADRPMMRADPHRPMPPDVFEVERRVARISLQ